MEHDVEWVRGVLKGIEVFSTLEDDEVNDFIDQMAFYQFKKNETIIKQGEASDFFFVVYEGSIKVTVKKMFFQQKQVAVLKRGDVFGEMALLTHSNRNATLVTQQLSSCFVLFKSSFQYIVNKNPFFKTRLQAIVRQREEEIRNA
ncbi:MAG: cyclic nucleotide-binding domain-containing protein [Candidatus Nitrohelix vancouverensis]|uniref:Cyclic nucleotide-binding domain-containing protein n=1 Tax=Candidatus Nitrohelix vancouverensis TaxID=2705534 RepID=A0A7T0C4H7_9BACT|nr:MAG: cyclic nucleotide-binding domain-containing protein [Candidatus Nitrohelix vancouverensis]